MCSVACYASVVPMCSVLCTHPWWVIAHAALPTALAPMGRLGRTIPPHTPTPPFPGKVPPLPPPQLKQKKNQAQLRYYQFISRKRYFASALLRPTRTEHGSGMCLVEGVTALRPP